MEVHVLDYEWFNFVFLDLSLGDKTTFLKNQTIETKATDHENRWLRTSAVNGGCIYDLVSSLEGLQARH